MGDLTKEQLDEIEHNGVREAPIYLLESILAMARRTLEAEALNKSASVAQALVQMMIEKAAKEAGLAEAKLAETRDEANKLRMELEIARGELHFTIADGISSNVDNRFFDAAV